jgi:hypothetical protein
MRNSLCLLFPLLILGSPLFGQSKSETIAYITREIKSCENDQLELKDIEFTEGCGVCKIRLSMPNQIGEKSLELSLKDVDIYSITKILKIGNDEQVYVYSLVANPRGRSGAVRRNMTTIMGADLTELITGQTKLFKP